MNLQSMLLIGMLLGSNVADISYYEGVYREYYKEKQENMHIEQAKENAGDVEALTKLGNYYEELWEDNTYDSRNFDKAEFLYKEVIAINPKSTELAEFYLNAVDKSGYYYRTEMRDEIELYKISEEEILRLLEIDKDNIYLWTSLGDLYSEDYYFADDDYHSEGEYYGAPDEIKQEIFNNAEKAYLEALKIDENNFDVRYKLIDLYGNEWWFARRKYGDDRNNEDNYKHFEKIEQQYLDILSIDENNMQARYDLIKFYENCYWERDIDCVDKMEAEFLEISKRETKEQYNIDIPISLGNLFSRKWHYASNFTSDKDFELAEYYYKYALNIEPNNSEVKYELANLYEEGYYYRNVNHDKYFKNAERLYKEYLLNSDVKPIQNAYFKLACLYEYKWLEDKSDYTYYYMAEDELYNALDFSLELEAANSTDLYFGPMYYYEYFKDFYIVKYVFDGDESALDAGKNLFVERISSAYSDEVSYMDNGTEDTYVDREKLEELGTLYRYIWALDVNDIQYFEKAEEVFLELQNMWNDYDILFQLGEMYTERWLIDKSNEEYRVKAMQYFDEILADEDSEGRFLENDVYWIMQYLE